MPLTFLTSMLTSKVLFWRSEVQQVIEAEELPPFSNKQFVAAGKKSEHQWRFRSQLGYQGERERATLCSMFIKLSFYACTSIIHAPISTHACILQEGQGRRTPATARHSVWKNTDKKTHTCTLKIPRFSVNNVIEEISLYIRTYTAMLGRWVRQGRWIHEHHWQCYRGWYKGALRKWRYTIRGQKMYKCMPLHHQCAMQLRIQHINNQKEDYKAQKVHEMWRMLK